LLPLTEMMFILGHSS